MMPNTKFASCDIINKIGFALQISFDKKTTGWSKKLDTQFYFWDNFGNSVPILTILSMLQAEVYGA